MKHGQTVAAFEREFAAYVGAKYAVALCNGTATLHTALVALGVLPGERVAVPPLTMASTTLAVLHAGAVPVYCDVDARTWLMDREARNSSVAIGVSLYGLPGYWRFRSALIDDAAQTLRQHSGAAFTSYSFQASKILALGEGGMLVTNDEDLAASARVLSSLGYRMRADQPRIDPNALKSPTFDRHHAVGWNYRMNDLTAAEGLAQLARADDLRAVRATAAVEYYAQVLDDLDPWWLTPQYVPAGWTHDYWTYAVACDTPDRALRLADAIQRHGGERPYPAWRITYHEPALRHLAPAGTCPVAESLQPRLVQCQTNDLASAERNAAALRRAIQEIA